MSSCLEKNGKNNREKYGWLGWGGKVITASAGFLLINGCLITSYDHHNLGKWTIPPGAENRENKPICFPFLYDAADRKQLSDLWKEDGMRHKGRYEVLLLKMKGEKLGFPIKKPHIGYMKLFWQVFLICVIIATICHHGLSFCNLNIGEKRIELRPLLLCFQLSLQTCSLLCKRRSR